MANQPTDVTYRVDPDDPRAPPQTVWDALSPERRRAVLASLPSDPYISEMPPGEGDEHYEATDGPRKALRRFFERTGKRIYVGTNLAVYYPDEKVFVPDLFAVVDVGTHARTSWVVSDEGKGLDFVLEVHVAGDWRKDFVRNVERYARLRIGEYFAFDLRRGVLVGYRLDGASYASIRLEGGRLDSHVLGLELAVEHDRVRFLVAGAPLPYLHELVGRLEMGMDEALMRLRDLERTVEEQEHRIDREHGARERAEAENAELRAELERLRRGGS